MHYLRETPTACVRPANDNNAVITAPTARTPIRSLYPPGRLATFASEAAFSAAAAVVTTCHLPPIGGRPSVFCRLGRLVWIAGIAIFLFGATAVVLAIHRYS